MSVSKRVRIYTLEDVANHRTAESCWVVHSGKVYDITAFLPDHPGGDDIVIEHSGQEVDDFMNDPAFHDHSDSAFEMMPEFCIGRVGEGEKIVDDGKSRGCLCLAS
jgi:4-hydroxysphinganine ceramide fatty acyl 2-hydroxylase